MRTCEMQKQITEQTLAYAQTEYGNQYAFGIMQVTKANYAYTGLAIRPKDVATYWNATLDLDELAKIVSDKGYGEKDNSIVEHAVDHFVETAIREQDKINFAIRTLEKYDAAKDQICIRLLDPERNQDFLKDKIVRPFLNLSEVVYAELTNADGTVLSTCVPAERLHGWGKSANEVLDQAEENTRSREYMILQMPRFLYVEPNEEPKIHIASTADNLYGASILLTSRLWDFAKEQDSDLYILPSSVHELLLIKKQDMNEPDELVKIVKSVNRSDAIEAKDVLADCAYYLDKTTGEIKVLCEPDKTLN